MMIGGPLDDKNAARLLSAAALLDFMFLGFVVATLEPVLRQELRLHQAGLALPIGLFLVLVLIYWLICEGILSGATIGRFVMRLNMRDKSGKPVSAMRRSSRAMKKIMTLGLTGLNPNSAARYDRAAEVRWFSPMAPRPIKMWRLAVSSGPDQGKSIVFRDVPGIASTHQIKIGRDSGWADLSLERSKKASGQHCVIQIAKGNQLYLRDLGSSNGTFIGGRQIRPEKPTRLGMNSRFRVGDVWISIIR